MSLNRYAKRKDANQAEVVQALEACGWSVFVLDRPCDLLLGKAGVNLLLEVKDGSKTAGNRPLTAAQVKFQQEWRGQFDVVTSQLEALAVAESRLGRFLSGPAL